METVVVVVEEAVANPQLPLPITILAPPMVGMHTGIMPIQQPPPYDQCHRYYQSWHPGVKSVEGAAVLVVLLVVAVAWVVEVVVSTCLQIWGTRHRRQ